MTYTVAVFTGLIALLFSPAWATELRSGDSVSVEAGEVIEDDLFAAGRHVLVAGRVKGDLFAFGQTVRITGPVEGSVMAAGQQVRVTGNVDGSVRAAGQGVDLGGSVGRNAAIAGQSLALAQAARIARDLHAAGQTIELDGYVGRQTSLAGQSAAVRGQVGERLKFEGDEIALASTARVGGDLVYRSPKLAAIAAGATVGGRTEHLSPRAAGAPRKRRSPIVPALVLFLVVFASGAVGLAALPRLVRSAADAMASRPWWNLLLGVLGLIVVPIAAIVVCCTVVGIPLAVLALVAWGAALLFSGVPVGIFVGRWLVTRLRGRPVSPYLALLLGLVVLALVGLVPYLGTLIKLVTVLLGLGVYARAAKGLLLEMRTQPT